MKINRLIAGIISLAMVFAMMPMMGQTVYAADRPSINIVDNGFASGIIGGQISNIYFGTYKQSISRAAMGQKSLSNGECSKSKAIL